jgi:membrane fusion protein (multidrug efflux system)
MAQMGPVPVEVAPVRSGKPTVAQSLVSTVEPVIRTTLATERAGFIQERLFDDGDHVQKGQVLARINTDLLEAELAGAKKSAEAMEFEVRQETASLARSKQEVERLRPLVDSRAVPQGTIDDAERDLAVAEARKAMKEQALGQQQAEIRRLQLQIEKCTSRAPFSGVIARRHIEVGMWVNQGAAVAEIVQLDPLFVRTSVPEAMIREVRKGSTVEVKLDALPGKTIVGTVEQVLPEADAATRSFTVRVKVNNPDGLIKPGLFARTTFYATSGEDVWIVPRDALVYRGTVVHVVAAREGKAVVIPITFVGGIGDSAQVRADLQPGDVVVVRGNDGLMGGEMLQLPPATSQTGAADAGPATAPSGG